MSASHPAFEMRGITKRFPGVLANDCVSFAAAQGEIHALLGENGAGKSTLMNILSGLYQPNEGTIHVDGRAASFNSPRDAIAAGIGMVHQHFMLVPVQSVVENIYLGMKEAGFVLNQKRMAQAVQALGAEHGMPVDPYAKIWQLSVGEQQRVEIIKMLFRGARILILDEPTAVLTPQECEGFFATLRSMANAGKTIIFISHKLDEVLAIADRITVLRAGCLVDTVENRGLTKADLADKMVGRKVLFRLDKPPHAPGAARLALHDVEARNNRDLPALRKLSLEVRSGEIVGIAGVAGNGQRELAEVICGLRPLSGGTVSIAGRPVRADAPLAMIRAGVAYVPEDRSATGSAPGMSVAENLALKAYRDPALGGRFFLRRKTMEEQAGGLVERFNISTPSVATPVRKLSGGNLQKVILAREISAQPQVLIAAYPTRGLDIGATENVRRILLDERNAGAAILLISEDLDEIFALADRIAVICDGRIVGEMPCVQADRQGIGLLMAGHKATA